MNFFEYQEQAQRKTVRLVIYYFFGLFLTFLAIHLLVAAVASLILESQQGNSGSGEISIEAIRSVAEDPLYILIDLAAVTLVVGGGTLFKVSQLKGLDGDGIARNYGGTQVLPGKASWKEKRLLNIVEEMAIASGVPVPNVYIMRGEHSINAFAAGFTPQTSVISVTQGALDYLTRDELQGVIAHEFSHLLHHDTRLNMKLIGVLFGLEMIAIIGYVLIRFAPHLASASRSRDNDKNSSAMAVFLLILGVGIALLIIGLVGQLFANIIRAAISRQREFLADASAVQFTRNPNGIGGALKKIGSRVGGHISNNHAVEASHLFFSNIFGSGLSGLFNSHPNLTVRIKRLDPQFNGEYQKVISKITDEKEFETPAPKPSSAQERLHRLLSQTSGGAGERLAGSAGKTGTSSPSAAGTALAAAILSSAEEVSRNKIRIAESLLEKIPDEISQLLQTPDGAVSMVLAVLLDESQEIREKQLEYLKDQGNPELFSGIRLAAEKLRNISPSVKIPIVQKSFPLLRTIPKEEYTKLRQTAITLMKFDGTIDLFEFTLFGYVFNNLDAYFRLAPPASEKFDKPGQIAEPFRQVASHLAYASSGDPAECQRAFSLAAAQIGLKLEICPKETCTNATFSTALRLLSQTGPRLRQNMLKAFYSCITADGLINETEGLLIRAVTAYFQCPMPTWHE